MKFILFICALLLPPFAFWPVAEASDDNETIIIFAAASTSHVMESIKNAYEAKNPNVKIRVSYGASALLARQISQGAPADLFLSANKQWINWLSNNKANISEPVIVAQNRLVVITPRHSTLSSCPLNKEEYNKILDHKKFIIADPNISPLGQYSKEALKNLGQWKDVEDKLAVASNATMVLKMIERGAAPLGIAYASGVANNDFIKMLCWVKLESYSPINYYLVNVGPASQAKMSFIHYINHQSAKQWIDAGFDIMRQNETDLPESK